MPRVSLLGKFLAFQLPAFLLAVALGLHLYAERRVEAARDQFGARVGSQAARIGKLVADLDPRADPAAANRVLTLLLSDRAVLCAEIEAEGIAPGAVAAPRRFGCRSERPDDTLRVELTDGLTLALGLSNAEIAETRRSMSELALALALAGALLAGGAAAFAFRRTIGAPLDRLNRAIRRAEETGEATLVANASRDELGRVIDAFNTMQTRLASDRAALADASRRLGEVYDTTPALLFSITPDGVIVGVSGFWLEATGYPREEVIGQPFARFLAPAARARLKSGVLADIETVGEVRDVPLTLWRRDGAEIDVLFSAAPQTCPDGGRHAVCVMSDVSMLRAAERQLREMALTDPLTGLPNRAGLAERMRDMLAAAREPAALGAVMLIDLDNFKWVNDTYGHAVGDRLLIEATRRIRACLRAGDILARLGGDEFAVLCPSLATEDEAGVIARSIVAAFARGVDLDGVTGQVGASVGVAFTCGEDVHGAELLRRADQAMYAAKQDGKGRCAIFDDAAPESVGVDTGSLKLLEDGLRANLFRLHYQPIIDLVEMRAVGAEALLRYEGGDDGVAPQSLIRVAEETGLIDKLGDRIIEAATAGYARLSVAAGGDFRLHVNLSARQLNESLAGRIKRLLARRPELRDRLVLEITETAAIRRFDLVCAMLDEMRGQGARVALDDFGAGYSSLSYVSRLPVDFIKLDRSYVAAFDPAAPQDEETIKRRALARSIVTLARELGVDLIAEGVETMPVVDAMRTLGVRYAQGWAFARAMPADAAGAWLGHFRAEPPPRQATARLSIVA